MSDSKIAEGIMKLVNSSSKLIGKLQNGINKVLWGNPSADIVQTVDTNKTKGATAKVLSNVKQGFTNLVQAGLFNALDILNEVDLCSILTYLTDNIHIKKKPRPDKASWNATQTALYALQDKAALVQGYIDKFTAYPNIFIGSYLGTGPNAVPPEQAISQSNAPTEGGSRVTAYNLYFLMQSFKDTFSFGSNSVNSLFSEEDKILLSVVPGLGSNLNIIDDFIGTVNKYTDYRQIPNAEVQRLVDKITTIRSVCVTIQNLDFQNALALVGNFLSTDIRAQIQKLGKFLDPTKIVRTLKEINNSLRSFIKIAKQVQGILRLGQFLIKLALIFIKVFRFIVELFSSNPLPLVNSISAVQTRFQNASDVARSEIGGAVRILKAINSLLSVLLNFIRYLLVNTNELLVRLDRLLTNLEACDAVKNSDVISELKQTRSDLVDLRDQLNLYITQYDSKTNANTAMFGKYDIRVIDEEITDPSIQNKRRRGIALDTDGQIVAQSDLTFATNTAVIIAEVQQKLLALHLVPSNMGQFNAANLAVIAESVNYLDSNDIVDNDLVSNVEMFNTTGAEQTANISQFVDKLPGGPEFKQKSRDVTSTYTTNAKKQVTKQTSTRSGSIKY